MSTSASSARKRTFRLNRIFTAAILARPEAKRNYHDYSEKGVNDDDWHPAIRRIPPLLAKKESQDGQASQPWELSRPAKRPKPASARFSTSSVMPEETNPSHTCAAEST